MIKADDDSGHDDNIDQQQERGKAVVFDTVHVRHYERVTLMNEDGGTALGLGWDFFDHPHATPIEIYEQIRPPPRSNFRIRSRLSMTERVCLLSKYYAIKKPKIKNDLLIEFEGLDILQERRRGDRRTTLCQDRLLSGEDDSLSLDALEGNDLIVDFTKSNDTEHHQESHNCNEAKEDVVNTFHDAKSNLFSSASSLFESLGEEKLMPKDLEVEIVTGLIPTQERLHLRRPRRKCVLRQVSAKGA